MTAQTGNATGVVIDQKRQVSAFIEFADTPGTVITNPAALAGVAGVMTQVALQKVYESDEPVWDETRVRRRR